MKIKLLPPIELTRSFGNYYFYEVLPPIELLHIIATYSTTEVLLFTLNIILLTIILIVTTNRISATYTTTDSYH